MERMICGEGEQAAAVEKGTKKREAHAEQSGKNTQGCTLRRKSPEQETVNARESWGVFPALFVLDVASSSWLSANHSASTRSLSHSAAPGQKQRRTALVEKERRKINRITLPILFSESFRLCGGF